MGVKIEKVSKREYCLLESVTVEANGYKITVKAGLVFDGASIPRSLWSLVGSPFTGGYTRAALVHDALYMGEALERSVCDAIFLELMKKDAVNWLKRNVMYAAVRSAGWLVWRNHDKSLIEANRKYTIIEEIK